MMEMVTLKTLGLCAPAPHEKHYQSYTDNHLYYEINNNPLR